MNRRMSSAYDRIAPLYAHKYAEMPPELIDFGQRFLDHLAPQPLLLDAGCGAGRDMAWLEAHGAEVQGIDLSPGMLRQVQERVLGAVRLMDMRNLDFAAQRFDGEWCTASLLHLPKADAPGVLAEIRRVLKPKGCLFLSLQVGSGEGWEPGSYDAEVERFFARYTEEEADALIQSAGFEILARATSTGGGRIWMQRLGRKT